MKQLVLLYGDNCGYCKKAKMLLDRALTTHPEYQAVAIRHVHEQSEEAAVFSHQLIPAFFCDGALFFEGNPNMDTVIAVLEYCLKDEKRLK